MKERENITKYKEAFEQIKQIVGSESSLEKITSDFVRIEDANFALFNYVTEMNNQVETLQDSIAKLKQDIKVGEVHYFIAILFHLSIYKYMTIN